jgi:Ca2+-binding EF-hand superfamily protein
MKTFTKAEVEFINNGVDQLHQHVDDMLDIYGRITKDYNHEQECLESYEIYDHENCLHILTRDMVNYNNMDRITLPLDYFYMSEDELTYTIQSKFDLEQAEKAERARLKSMVRLREERDQYEKLKEKFGD